MNLRRLPGALLVLAAFVMPSAAHAEWSHDPTSETTRFTTYLVVNPVSVSDGAGGFYTAFTNLSAGGVVYVQHTSATGALLLGNSVALSGQTTCIPEGIVPDGSGGFVCVWTAGSAGSRNLYAQRMNSSGTAMWTAGGVTVCAAAYEQSNSVIADDGAGGAIIAWEDARANNGTTDVYAQRLNASGVTQWTANGLAVCTSSGNQSHVGIVSDESGGAILCWMDARGANYAVYVQRLSSAGSAGWGANGLALTGALADDQWNPVVAPDGREGAIVAWHEWRSGNADIYAQRLSIVGATVWATNGVAVCSASGDQVDAAIVPDGSSGAVIAWVDNRASSNDVYAQRVGASGTVQWSASGVALCTAPGNQPVVKLVGDGSGGAIAIWNDRRSLVDDDVYAAHVTSTGSANWTADGVALETHKYNAIGAAIVPDGAGGAFVTESDYVSGAGCMQHVDRFGVMGGAAPSITAVDDVPNDEGGYVSIRWNKSWLDNSPGGQISYYYVWRQVPQVAAQAALRAGAKLVGANEEPRVGALRATGYAATTYYWELLGSVTAMGQAGYSVVEPTRGDSIAGSNPSTLFMIEARYNLISGAYWDSDPLGGYSVDNVAPATPAPFTGVYENGLVALQWGASTASDFAEYRLYRGGTSSFVPGPSTYVGSLLDPSYADSPGVPRWYKVVAVDVHGNVSAPATLLPTGTLGVDEAAAYALAFAPPAPNPARGRATIAFTLPAAGSARLALYDVAGRCVRVLADGEQSAGEHRLELELRDAAGGALPAGLYLARLEAAGRTLVRRVVVER